MTSSSPTGKPQRKAYASDLSDAQWALIVDFVPQPNPHPNFPAPTYSRREIFNGILYFLRSGCPWRALPHDFPPWESVASDYYQWKKSGVLDTILVELREKARVAAGATCVADVGDHR
jgi:putative transposase